MNDNNDDAANPIYIGPAGWHYDDWKGIVYPSPMPSGVKPLSLICRSFDLVEINVTFYRLINPKICAGWIMQCRANPRFLFTAKLPQVLTHGRDAIPDSTAVRGFQAGVRPLLEADRLGAVLAQFPWSFRRTPENRRYLARLADLCASLPLAIEVRHRSWDCPEFYESLRERNIACCNIDQPVLDQCLPPAAHVTGSIAYVRLHGRNRACWFGDAGRDARYNYLYSGKELAPWIQRILEMKTMVQRLFVVTNNHYRGQAVVNALEMQAALGILRSEIPQPLRQCYPHLSELQPRTAPGTP